ncbi:MAG: hypothetical protein LBH66_01655 [Oscillospiraceae bacterium]|nr:hypothetical protein [Oscillospiraceae bacterium]
MSGYIDAGESLLGLPLERALDILSRRGVPAPDIKRTAAPDFFAARDPQPRPDVRVVRVRPGELTVAAFRASPKHGSVQD